MTKFVECLLLIIFSPVALVALLAMTITCFLCLIVINMADWIVLGRKPEVIRVRRPYKYQPRP